MIAKFPYHAGMQPTT